MRKHNALNAALILLAAFIFVLGCSGGDQQAEVNKLVDQTNKKLEEAKDLLSKTETRYDTLSKGKVNNVAQLHEYRGKMSGEAKSIIADYDKAIEMIKDVAKQYDEISRMKVVDKYKEYAKLKSDAFAKRAEAIGFRKANVQVFLDMDDLKAMAAKFDENNGKYTKMLQDADDVAAKAKKIEDENKDIFK